MKSTALITSLFAVAATAHSSQEARQFTGSDAPMQKPAEKPMLGKVTSQGCFSSKGDLKSTNAGISKNGLMSGYCAELCDDDNFVVAALAPDGCYCGNSMPSENALVDDKKCNHACPGYVIEACGGKVGGDMVFSVYNLGKELDPPISGESGDANDKNDEEDGENSTATNGRSSVTGTNTSTITESSESESAVSTGAMETTTTASAPAETTSSSNEEGEDESEEESGDDEGEGDAGSTIGRSVAVVAAVAGGSAWFLL